MTATVHAQDSEPHAADTTGADHYSHGFEHRKRYADDWNDPSRDRWQKPDVLLDAMGVTNGMTVADLGTGTGYFVSPLSQAAGSDGTVLAVNIEPTILS